MLLTVGGVALLRTRSRYAMVSTSNCKPGLRDSLGGAETAAQSLTR